MINLSLSRFKPSTWSVLRKAPHPALHEEEEEEEESHWIQTLFKHLSGSLQLTVSEGVSRNSQGKYCKFNLCTVK